MSTPSSFSSSVARVVTAIPPGQVRTYGQVAAAAGRPGAARAVGTILAHNEDPDAVPCHRVVRADLTVGDYAFGGPLVKREILEAEGVPFDGHGRIAPAALGSGLLR